MKFKKLSAVAAAMALASTMAISASATNWAAASYADNNPDTCEILSTDENSITFTQVNDGTAAKIRITLSDILENPDDTANIKSGSWKVTYNNVPADFKTGDEFNASGLGGGTYAATGNSATYWISPSYDDDGNGYYEESYEVDDSFKWLLPSSVPSDPTTAEFVFMDWSNSDIQSQGVTITISDFKLFDADGNEIAQKAYGGEAAPAAEEEAPAEAEAPAEEAPVEEEAPAEEAPAEEAAPAADEAPASDDTTTAAATGNTSAVAIAAVMGVAAAAAAVSKKRK